MKNKKAVASIIVCLGAIIGTTIMSASVATTSNTKFFIALFSIFKTHSSSIYTILSIILFLFDIGFILFLGYEIPKIRSAQMALWFFSLHYSYQCLCDVFSTRAKEIGALATTFIFLLFYTHILWQNYKATKMEPDDTEETTSLRALVKYSKRKIIKTHQNITSIQVHKVIKTEKDGQINYDIEYIDSGRKNAFNLNAVLNSQLTIPKETYDFFQPFGEAYEGYLKAEDSTTQTSFKDTLELLSNDQISKIKDKLSTQITDVASITIGASCMARVILTYLSCLARIGQETADDYVGVKCKSLNICPDCEETDKINEEIFSKYRTGFLGAILLKNRPYVFYYEQDLNDTKANRRYIVFILDHEKAKNTYLILVSVNLPKDNEAFHVSLLNAIRSIHEECIKIYEKHEVRPYE